MTYSDWQRFYTGVAVLDIQQCPYCEQSWDGWSMSRVKTHLVSQHSTPDEVPEGALRDMLGFMP